MLGSSCYQLFSGVRNLEKGVKNAFIGIGESLGEWLSSIDSSGGTLRRVSPIASLIGTIVAVGPVSFARTPIPIIFGLVSSLILTLVVNGEFSIRALKISLIWAIFTLIIMLPKTFLDPTVTAYSLVLPPIRVFSSIFILSTCVLLVGFNRLITGAIKLGIPKELAISIELMVAQISKQLVELGRLIIAKSSRLFSRRGLLEEYGILSTATSELFIRGPNRAFRLSTVIESRLWTDLDDIRPSSLVETAIFLIVPLASLLGLLLEVFYG